MRTKFETKKWNIAYKDLTQAQKLPGEKCSRFMLVNYTLAIFILSLNIIISGCNNPKPNTKTDIHTQQHICTDTHTQVKNLRKHVLDNSLPLLIWLKSVEEMKVVITSATIINRASDHSSLTMPPVNQSCIWVTAVGVCIPMTCLYGNEWQRTQGFLWCPFHCHCHLGVTMRDQVTSSDHTQLNLLGGGVVEFQLLLPPRFAQW